MRTFRSRFYANVCLACRKKSLLLRYLHRLPSRQLPLTTLLAPCQHDMKMYGTRFPAVVAFGAQRMPHDSGAAGYGDRLVRQINGYKIGLAADEALDKRGLVLHLS